MVVVCPRRSCLFSLWKKNGPRLAGSVVGDPVVRAVTVVLRVLNRAGMPAVTVVAERSVVAIFCDLSVVGAVPFLSKFRLRLCRWKGRRRECRFARFSRTIVSVSLNARVCQQWRTCLEDGRSCPSLRAKPQTGRARVPILQGTIHVVDLLIGIVANVTVGCLPSPISPEIGWHPWLSPNLWRD